MKTVAIQGEAGAFSHAAAIQALGSSVRLAPCRSFDELFRTLLEGNADRGVVPIENTLAGAVQRPVDLLALHPVHAVAETRVRIELCLATRPGRDLEEVTTAASHPVALAQCLGFFRAHPHIVAREAYDTAGSIRDLMAGAADYDAAIGSRLAAELYGAAVLRDGIEDHPDNFTRFLIVAREPGVAPEERAKTSVVFSLPHRPGALARAIDVLAEAGTDLTRIESRPIAGRPWEYRFSVDIRGASRNDQDAALDRLREVVTELRVIGRYSEERTGSGP